MSKNTDTNESFIVTGTLTVKAHPDGSIYGNGDVEAEGTMKTDNLSSNIINNGTINLLSKLQSTLSNTIQNTSNNVINSVINTTGDISTNSLFIFSKTGNIPILTTRSIGTCIVFKPLIASNSLDTAIGINNTNGIWFSGNNYQMYNLSGSIIFNISSSGSINVPTITTPSAPNPGFVTIYADSADLKMKSIDTLGIVTPFGGGSSTSPLTNKGDLFTHNGTTGTRLPVGSPGQVIVPDNTQVTGLKWSSYVPYLSDRVGENYGTANTAIGTSFTDIQIDQYRTITSGSYVNSVTNTDMIISEAGVYFVTAKVCLTKTVGTGQTICTVKMVDDTSGSGTFSDVPGAFGFALCGSTANGVSDTVFISYIKSYPADSRIKMVAQKSFGTTANTITQRVLGVNLNVVNFMLDICCDTSSYFHQYSLSSQNLTTTFADIPINTLSINIGSVFTYNSPSISVSKTGVYFIMLHATINKTSGTDASLAAFQLLRNNSTVISTIGNAPSFNATVGRGNVSIPCLVSLTSGDTIKIQGRTQAGTNLVCTSAVLNAVYLESSINNQGSADFLSLTSTTNTLLNTGVTDIPFQTQVVNTGTAFTHNTVTNNNEITITEDGYYYIFSNMTYSNSTTTISNAQILTLFNNTVAYNMFEGSYSEGIVNISTGSGNVKTITTSNFVYLPANFKIKVQGLRISSGGACTTIGNQCSIVIFKGNQITTSINTLKPFGDYFNAIASNTTQATTSTSFVVKGLTPTGFIPSGFYKIEWQYKEVTPTANAIHESQILLYSHRLGVATQLMIHRPPAQTVITNTPIHSGFLYRSLLSGSYTLEFSFRSVAGTNVAVREVQLSIFRIK